MPAGLWYCWNISVLAWKRVLLATNGSALRNCSNFHLGWLLLLLREKVSPFHCFCPLLLSKSQIYDRNLIWMSICFILQCCEWSASSEPPSGLRSCLIVLSSICQCNVLQLVMKQTWKKYQGGVAFVKSKYCIFSLLLYL